MKKLLLSTLFLIFCIGSYAQDKTYIIKIEGLTLNSVVLSWQRADGTSEKDTTHDYTLYYCEYGPKGFERGKGVIGLTAWAGNIIKDLIPGTEYSFYIRKETVPADSSVWFEEYNFKTLSCNTSISNIKTEMEYANGVNIKDLIDVHISFDALANSFELQYGPKGFEKGSGTIITSNSYKGFSIGNANLQSNTEYDYYIRGKCNSTYGEWSEKNTFTTTEVFHYLGSEAFDVYFENITNKSATVRWYNILGGYSKYYYIEFGPKGFVRGTGQKESTMFNSYYLTGLEPDTEYSIFIRSNDISPTEPVWFTEHSFKTFPCSTEISGVESTEMLTTGQLNYGTSSVWIRWDGKADSYELEYGLKGFQQGTGEMIKVEGESSTTLSNLNNYTDYDFYIRAECNGGFGEWTSKNSFSTTQNSDIKTVRSSSFEIYPNPVEDILHIKLNPAFDINNTNVDVFDLIGSLRYKSVFNEEYNVSSLPAGAYIVRVKDKQLSGAKIIQKK